MLINDYQRGRLPHYVAPPELKEDDEKVAGDTAVIRGVKLEQQNLDGIERSVEVEEAKGSDVVNTTEEGVKGDDDSEEEDAPVSLAVKGGEEWD